MSENTKYMHFIPFPDPTEKDMNFLNLLRIALEADTDNFEKYKKMIPFPDEFFGNFSIYEIVDGIPIVTEDKKNQAKNNYINFCKNFFKGEKLEIFLFMLKKVNKHMIGFETDFLKDIQEIQKFAPGNFILWGVRPFGTTIMSTYRINNLIKQNSPKRFEDYFLAFKMNKKTRLYLYKDGWKKTNLNTAIKIIKG